MTSATEFKVTVTSQTEMLCDDEAGIMVGGLEDASSTNYVLKRAHFPFCYYIKHCPGDKIFFNL